MGELDIRLLDLNFLKGPNRWSYRPAMEALVDIGELEEWPSNLRPDVVASLRSLLPGLQNHGCSYEEPGGFLRRLEEGTWPAHILEHITLELLEQTGHPVGFGRARSAGPKGHYYVVVRSRYQDLTFACFEAARRILVALYRGKSCAPQHEIGRLRELARAVSLPAASARLLLAAERSKIPCQRVGQTDLLVVGHGPRQRRMWRGATDGTSAIAEGIARDRALAHRLLREAGLPTPLVGSFQKLEELVEEIDVDCSNYVVKSGRAHTPSSVTLNPTNLNDLRHAVERALEFDTDVLLERRVPGDEYEVLVISGRVVSVVRAAELELHFDGSSTLSETLGREVEAHLRGPFQVCREALIKSVLSRPLARGILGALDLTAESVPAQGYRLSLPLPAGIGGTPLSVPVNESVARSVVTAVRVVGLDVATVALVAPHLRAPLEESGGAILGVDACPDFLSHLPRPEEKGDPVADALLECLVPVREGARIAVTLVAGSRDGDEIAGLLGHFLRVSGKRVGSARCRGVWLNDRLIRDEPATFEVMENLVFNRTIEAATIHVPIPTLVSVGLPADRSFVSIVTGFDGELARPHLPDHAAYERLMRTLADVVLPEGAAVLNADDEGARGLAEFCDGEVIYYGTQKSAVFLEEFASRGGRSLGFRSGQLVLRSGNFVLERPMGNHVAPSVWLPAIAAALKYNLTPELLVAALHSMDPSAEAKRQGLGRRERASRPDL